MKGVYTCVGDGFEALPADWVRENEIAYPAVHTEPADMEKLARAFGAYRQDGFVRLPFCTTLEADALGADITLGDAVHGPRVADYVLQTQAHIEAFLDRDVETLSDREKAVLRVISNLSRTEEVIFCITGPFTVATSLMSPALFYRELRKKPEQMGQLLTRIEAHIVMLARAGVQAGASVLSYADPVGGMDIVGAKVFRDHSGPSAVRVLSKLEGVLRDEMTMRSSGKLVTPSKGVLLHICGKMSHGLSELGMCRVQQRQCSGATYGEKLKSLRAEQPVCMVGHRCIKEAGRLVSKSYMNEIDLVKGYVR